MFSRRFTFSLLSDGTCDHLMVKKWQGYGAMSISVLMSFEHLNVWRQLRREALEVTSLVGLRPIVLRGRGATFWSERFGRCGPVSALTGAVVTLDSPNCRCFSFKYVRRQT